MIIHMDDRARTKRKVENKENRNSTGGGNPYLTAQLTVTAFPRGTGARNPVSSSIAYIPI